MANLLKYTKTSLWRDAGVVELAALEKRYGATHRGFESLSLRQTKYAPLGRI